MFHFSWCLLNCAGCDTVERLQCSFNVSAGVGDNALPAGIHVSGDTLAAHLYELCGAVAPRSYALHYWDSRQLSALQKAFPVSALSHSFSLSYKLLF